MYVRWSSDDAVGLIGAAAEGGGNDLEFVTGNIALDYNSLLSLVETSCSYLMDSLGVVRSALLRSSSSLHNKLAVQRDDHHREKGPGWCLLDALVRFRVADKFVVANQPARSKHFCAGHRPHVLQLALRIRRIFDLKEFVMPGGWPRIGGGGKTPRGDISG